MTDAGICWLIVAVVLSSLGFFAYAALCVASDADDVMGAR
jgi:hypothetical protein